MSRIGSGVGFWKGWRVEVGVGWVRWRRGACEGRVRK